MPGPPSFEVTAENGNASPVTVHTVQMVFVDYLTGQEITTVTERTAVTIPGGQFYTFVWDAPPVLADIAVPDKDVEITVTSWS